MGANQPGPGGHGAIRLTLNLPMPIYYCTGPRLSLAQFERAWYGASLPLLVGAAPFASCVSLLSSRLVGPLFV